MTVFIIKVYNPNYDDTNDAQILLEKFMENKKEDKRQTLFVINYENFKDRKLIRKFEEELVKYLPQHVGTLSF